MHANMPEGHLHVKTGAAEYAYLGVEPRMPLAHTPGMNRIRDIRKARGLTQKQLADKIGANQSTVSKIEKGIANPTQQIMTRLADALDVEPIEFYELSDLQDRTLDALARMDADQRWAALTVLEAMASQSKPPESPR